jgi:glycosyltransferase involved in cell wall biosynthesis
VQASVPKELPHVSGNRVGDSPALDATVVVCTRNRARMLRKTLDAISTMEIPAAVRYEVIVVDNGSTDDTQEVVTSLADKLPISYVLESQPGLSNARNRGLAIARGHLIFFTDDDCYVSQDWLATGLRLLRDEPFQVVGGRVELHNPNHIPLTVKTDQQPSKLISAANLFGFLHGCNMAFGRRVLEEIGFFDRSLGAGSRCISAEDTDFVYRAFVRGIPVRYRPEFLVKHDHGRSAQAEADRLVWGYTVGQGAIAIKHLIRGRTDLAKVVYWDMRHQRFRIVAAYAWGAFLYLTALIVPFRRSGQNRAALSRTSKQTSCSRAPAQSA